MIMPSEFFEVVNGVLTIMFLWVIAWFVYDVACVYRECRSNWYQEAAPSIAAIVVFSGEVMIRGSVWYLRHADNNGQVVDFDRSWGFPVILAGIVVAMFGCACMIRNLAPYALGRMPWVVAVFSSLFLSLAIAFGIN